jgi:hypothetical protein
MELYYKDKTLPVLIEYFPHKQVFICNKQTLELLYKHLIAKKALGNIMFSAGQQHGHTLHTE